MTVAENAASEGVDYRIVELREKYGGRTNENIMEGQLRINLPCTENARSINRTIEFLSANRLLINEARYANRQRLLTPENDCSVSPAGGRASAEIRPRYVFQNESGSRRLVANDIVSG